MNHLLMLILCIPTVNTMLKAQTERDKGDTQTYHSAGLADGNGQVTKFRAFNPSPTDRLELTITATDDVGGPQLIFPENSGGMTPTFTHRVTLELPPFGGAELESGNVSDGRDSGFVTVESSGEAALWSTQESRIGDSLTGAHTNRLVENRVIGDRVHFPLAITAGADDLPGGQRLGLDGSQTDTILAIKNTNNFTATMTVWGTDAILGSDLGQTEITVSPNQGLRIPVSDLFPSQLTGNLQIDTLVTTGQAYPVLGFRGGPLNMEDFGEAFPDNPRVGSTTTNMAYYHSGDEQLSGFYVFDDAATAIPVNGLAQVALAPSQATTDILLQASSRRSVFLPTQSFTANPNQRNLGWARVTTDSDLVQGVGFLSSEGERTLLKARPALARRASFPFDGRLDWAVDYEPSVLIIERKEATSVVATATTLDEAGQVLEIGFFRLEQGVNTIPASQLVDAEGMVRTVLLEIDEGSEEVNFADFLVIGRDAVTASRILDRVPILNLSGPPTMANFRLILSAWRRQVESCLGSNLDVLDIVTYIDNNYQCP